MGYHDERLKLKKFIVIIIIIIIIIINEEENRVTPSHRDVAGALYII